MGVKLTAKLPAMDKRQRYHSRSMLRRHDVSGGVGKIIEYYGPALKDLTAMDRHIIANMGAELGATAQLCFHADDVVQKIHGATG